MVIRSWTRAFEKRFLRPLGRLVPRVRRGPTPDQLERRVEALEALVRELAGLVALALDERSPSGTRAADGDRGLPGPRPREAA